MSDRPRFVFDAGVVVSADDLDPQLFVALFTMAGEEVIPNE